MIGANEPTAKTELSSLCEMFRAMGERIGSLSDNTTNKVGGILGFDEAEKTRAEEAKADSSFLGSMRAIAGSIDRNLSEVEAQINRL